LNYYAIDFEAFSSLSAARPMRANDRERARREAFSWTELGRLTPKNEYQPSLPGMHAASILGAHTQ
jgi:hypothetical protein